MAKKATVLPEQPAAAMRPEYPGRSIRPIFEFETRE